MSVSEPDAASLGDSQLTLVAGLASMAGLRIFARSGMVDMKACRVANLLQHDCKSIVAVAMASQCIEFGVLRSSGELHAYPRLMTRAHGRKRAHLNFEYPATAKV